MAKASGAARLWNGSVSPPSSSFLLAAASDGLDGYVARHYNQRSQLGVILDPIADKGLLLSGIITLSITNWSQSDPDYGKFPVWFPVLVITAMRSFWSAPPSCIISSATKCG
jgi:phosphatidylglycerophosphate synthase